MTAWDIAAGTPDPELPVVTVADLGILRDVEETDGAVVVTITPTYSGCPAMREIATDVRRRLADAGYARVQVRTRLAPAWSSEWITADGRGKLAAAGLAPPTGLASSGQPVALTLSRPVPCPHCGSRRTIRTAAFGPTSCTALYRCEECREPFQYVKDI